mmetsp:Transcript_4094/g.14308  ORF Transcript_4094/g.14308 Transcript_4094/m.14308 type:complete len:229 (+) Transcript_4094:1097-1783(+)
MQEGVDVAMAVGLGLNLVTVIGREGEGRSVICQAGDLVLLQKSNAGGLEAKVVVLNEELSGLVVGVVGRHDHEGRAAALDINPAAPCLQSQNVLGIELEEARPSGALAGKGELDARIPEPLPEAARDEDKCSLPGLHSASLLQFDEFLAPAVENGAGRHLRSVPLQGVLPMPRRLKQDLGPLDVTDEASRSGLIQPSELPRKPLLPVLVLTGGRPRRHEVALARREEV